MKPLPLVPLLCSALLLASPPQPLRAAGAAAQQPPTIRINYVNADLGDVIRSLAVVLGVNVVLTNVPNRRITFQTPEPVPAAQVGGVLEAILESQGLVLVQTGPVAQVLPEERRPTTGPVRVGKELPTPPPLGLVTQIVPLDYMRADEAVALLKEVASKAARVERQRVQALEGRSLSSELTGFRRRELESLQQRMQAAPPALPAPPAAAPESGEAAVSGGGLVGGTTIVPDQATNSLVIRTAPPNFSVLQETIEQLDVRPPQVLLEVLIAEVTLDRAHAYGVNWQLFTQKVVSGDSTRGIAVGVGPPQFGDSVLAGLQGLGVRVISLASVDVRAILQALASRTNVRVLSTPRVLALNNEQARILVGSEVPFTSATLTSLNAVVNQVVQFRNVGTQLTVVPTVNNDGYVTFRVLQEVSALSAQTIAAAQNAPVITTREAETSAIVKTGHTVVIGGLIGETQQAIESGVPILKDVPLLGYFFRSRSLSRERTEIAIFLTPYVVFTDEQADSLLQQERDKLRNSKQPIDSALPPPPNPPERP